MGLGAMGSDATGLGQVAPKKGTQPLLWFSTKSVVIDVLVCVTAVFIDVER